jgi:hypothetical protein
MKIQIDLKQCLAVCCLHAGSVMAAGPLLHYNFDVPPNTFEGESVKDVSGNERDADILEGISAADYGARSFFTVEGVSASEGDYAAQLNTSPSAVVLTPAERSDLPRLDSFTISGWFDGNLNVADKILSAYGPVSSALQAHKTNDLQWVVGNDVIVESTGAAFGHAGWVFFALTYDSPNGVAKLWRGTVDDEVVEVAEMTVDGLGAWEFRPFADGRPGTGLNWGNTINFDRSVDAYLDDLRLYGAESGSGGALGQSELDAVRREALR